MVGGSCGGPLAEAGSFLPDIRVFFWSSGSLVLDNCNAIGQQCTTKRQQN